jgi:ribosomal protein S18 acetylase RimI-like enzyme
MSIQIVALEDGREADISFLKRSDSVHELQAFINSLVREDARIIFDRKVTLPEERAWKNTMLASMRRNDGYVLLARVDGKIAGTSGANRERGRGRGNVALGLAIAKPFRGVGLGESLLRANIAAAGLFFKPEPDNIYLSVFEDNKPAVSLYRKLGFKRFAVFPAWIPYGKKKVGHAFMKLER